MNSNRYISAAENIVPNRMNAEFDESVRTAVAFPQKTPFAMAYVPFQIWETPYSEDMGFKAGTMFKSLDMPFMRGNTKNE